MNPLAAVIAFLSIFIIGGPLTGGNTTASIGIGVVVYVVASILLSPPRSRGWEPPASN